MEFLKIMPNANMRLHENLSESVDISILSANVLSLSVYDFKNFCT